MEKTKTTNFEKKIEQGFGQIISLAPSIICPNPCSIFFSKFVVFVFSINLD